MKYGATPLIRMLGPKRRTSGATPFALSVPGGVPGPDSPGPETCSATRRTGNGGKDSVSKDRVFITIVLREVLRALGPEHPRGSLSAWCSGSSAASSEPVPAAGALCGMVGVAALVASEAGVGLFSTLTSSPLAQRCECAGRSYDVACD